MYAYIIDTKTKKEQLLFNGKAAIPVLNLGSILEAQNNFISATISPSRNLSTLAEDDLLYPPEEVLKKFYSPNLFSNATYHVGMMNNEKWKKYIENRATKAHNFFSSFKNYWPDSYLTSDSFSKDEPMYILLFVDSLIQKACLCHYISLIYFSRHKLKLLKKNEPENPFQKELAIKYCLPFFYERIMDHIIWSRYKAYLSSKNNEYVFHSNLSKDKQNIYADLYHYLYNLNKSHRTGMEYRDKYFNNTDPFIYIDMPFGFSYDATDNYFFSSHKEKKEDDTSLSSQKSIYFTSPLFVLNCLDMKPPIDLRDIDSYSKKDILFSYDGILSFFKEKLLRTAPLGLDTASFSCRLDDVARELCHNLEVIIWDYSSETWISDFQEYHKKIRCILEDMYCRTNDIKFLHILLLYMLLISSPQMPSFLLGFVAASDDPEQDIECYLNFISYETSNAKTLLNQSKKIARVATSLNKHINEELQEYIDHAIGTTSAKAYFFPELNDLPKILNIGKKDAHYRIIKCNHCGCFFVPNSNAQKNCDNCHELPYIRGKYSTDINNAFQNLQKKVRSIIRDNNNNPRNDIDISSPAYAAAIIYAYTICLHRACTKDGTNLLDELSDSCEQISSDEAYAKKCIKEIYRCTRISLNTGKGNAEKNYKTTLNNPFLAYKKADKKGINFSKKIDLPSILDTLLAEYGDGNPAINDDLVIALLNVAVPEKLKDSNDKKELLISALSSNPWLKQKGNQKERIHEL